MPEIRYCFDLNCHISGCDGSHRSFTLRQVDIIVNENTPIEPIQTYTNRCAICRMNEQRVLKQSQINYSWVCSDCINKERCEHCGRYTEDIITIENFSNDWTVYCNKCLDDLFNYSEQPNCQHCEYWIFPDELKTYRGSTWHSDCFYEVYFNCDGCGNTRNRLEENYNEEHDYFYCNECYANHTDEDENWPNCINEDIYLSPSFKNTGNIKRRYGIELECYNTLRDYPPCQDGFEVVEDGSLNSGRGEEYRSGILEGDRGLELIFKQCNALNRNQYKVDNSCGFHCHVDAHDLTELQLLNITSFIVAFEPFIYSFFSKRRQTGSYSQPLPLDFNGLREEKTKGAMRFKKEYLEGVNRYRGFNLQSVAKHGTIEFRYHSGTTNYEKVHQWINLCLRIVEYQKDIFWDRSRKFRIDSENNWKLFYSTLQLNESQIAYWNERRAKFSPAKQELCEVTEGN